MNLPVTTNLLNPNLIPSEAGPPNGLFDQWREQDPVHWNPSNENYHSPLNGSQTEGFWVLTRYQDVFNVSRNQTLFSSHAGGPVIWDMEGDALLQQQMNLMGMEPDQHGALKRLVVPPFSPRELASFEPDIKRVAKEIVDSVAQKGECEFVFDIASRLPVYTFCELMGVPEELRDEVFRLGNLTADTENYNQEDRGEPVMELFAIANQIAEQKRQTPDNSMLSRLVNGEINGEKPDPLTINMFVVTLSIAGHETTRSTAAHFLRLMNQHPDQFALLMTDLDKYLPNAIDEVLRYSPPVIKFRRTVTEDAQIGDQTVKKGDKVYLSYPAANRDPAMFTDPHSFDITRSNANKHLSFGTGVHVCLGARLARLQLIALLKEIFTRIPDIAMTGDNEMLKSIWFNAIIKMPVKFSVEK